MRRHLRRAAIMACLLSTVAVLLVPGTAQASFPSQCNSTIFVLGNHTAERAVPGSVYSDILTDGWNQYGTSSCIDAHGMLYSNWNTYDAFGSDYYPSWVHLGAGWGVYYEWTNFNTETNNYGGPWPSGCNHVDRWWNIPWGAHPSNVYVMKLVGAYPC